MLISMHIPKCQRIFMNTKRHIVAVLLLSVLPGFCVCHFLAGNQSSCGSLGRFKISWYMQTLKQMVYTKAAASCTICLLQIGNAVH